MIPTLSQAAILTVLRIGFVGLLALFMVMIVYFVRRDTGSTG